MVEDEDELAYLFKEALSGNRFIINVFTDPVAALESISAEHLRYRLVLSDVRMPRLDGVELARRIYGIDKKIRLILMTAFDQTDIPSAFQHEFVQKPVHIEKLRKLVYASANQN